MTTKKTSAEIAQELFLAIARQGDDTALRSIAAALESARREAFSEAHAALAAMWRTEHEMTNNHVAQQYQREIAGHRMDALYDALRALAAKEGAGDGS